MRHHHFFIPARVQTEFHQIVLQVSDRTYISSLSFLLTPKDVNSSVLCVIESCVTKSAQFELNFFPPFVDFERLDIEGRRTILLLKVILTSTLESDDLFLVVDA